MDGPGCEICEGTELSGGLEDHSEDDPSVFAGEWRMKRLRKCYVLPTDSPFYSYIGWKSYNYYDANRTL